MTAGIPGVGIGGVFYLVTALGMPVAEAARALRGRRDERRPRWRLALRQGLLAVGVLAGLVLTGWILAFVLPATAPSLGTLPEGVLAAPPRPSSALKAAAVLLSVLTLTVVLGLVEVFRLWRRLVRRGRLR